MWWDVLLVDEVVGFWEIIILVIVYFENVDNLENILLFIYVIDF